MQKGLNKKDMKNWTWSTVVAGLALAAVPGMWAQKAAAVGDPSIADTQEWIQNTTSDWGDALSTNQLISQSDGSPSKRIHIGVVFEGCDAGILKFEIDDSPAPNTHHFSTAYYFKLSDIDPDSIQIVDWRNATDAMVPSPSMNNGKVPRALYAVVSIRARNDNNTITGKSDEQTRFGPPVRPLVKGSNGYLTLERPSVFWAQVSADESSIFHVHSVNDEGLVMFVDYAPRFVKAFKHAVELCGGKASAF
jgi:hypothetical protein